MNAHELDFKQGPVDSDFEITVVLRDSDGNPTGKTKTFRTNSAYKLWEFYNRNSGKPRRKKKKGQPQRGKGKGRNRNKQQLPSDSQAQKILREMYKDDE